MNQYDTYFTTRPSEASYLMDKGFKGKLCSNPYDNSRPAWTFEGTAQLYSFVNEFKTKKGVNKCGSNNPR